MHRAWQGRIAALALTYLLAAPATMAIAAGGGTLRYGITVVPPTYGNPYGGNGTPGTLIWYALFDALTRLDDEGHLAPALALRWEAVSPTEWHFELRPGVRFSNGRVADAEAVAATFEWLGSEAGRRTVIGNELRNVTRVEVRGPRTLAFHTGRPDAALPARLAAVLIVEPASWAELGPAGFAKQPVGTGPFALVDWGERDKRAVLRANPDSWRAPRLDRLEFRVMPDNAVRLQALVAGEIDLSDAAVDDLPYLRARGLRSAHAPAMQVMSIALITGTGQPSPLADPRVRRALNHAVDKQVIADKLLGGLGRPAGQPASHVTVGYDPQLLPYRHDPALARRLLSEAGYADGFALDIDVVVTSAGGDGAIYQVVQQDLNDVGVRTTLRARTFGDWLRNYLSGAWKADAFGLSWNSAPYNDVTRPMEYFSCRKRNPFFCDPVLADRLETVNEEFDPERRAALLRELSRAYREAAPAIFLVETVDVFAMDAGVGGFKIANRVPVYEDLLWTRQSR